ncbi:MAG: hypothetical protein JZU49_03530 [Sulfuricurvum sp.]|nr:hypothetical protein [Sulfuricurvum sp.]
MKSIVLASMLICGSVYANDKVVFDRLIVAQRENLERLKKMGAKYVFFGKGFESEKAENHVIKNESFDSYLQSLLGNTSPADNKLEEGMKIEKRYSPECNEDQSWKASDLLKIGGMVASVAIGVAGASSGNVGVAEFGGNLGKASASTIAVKDGAAQSSPDTAPLVSSLTIESIGLMTPDFIEVLHRDGRTWRGHIFSLEEVESVLEKYMDVPYSTYIRTY